MKKIILSILFLLLVGGACFYFFFGKETKEVDIALSIEDAESVVAIYGEFKANSKEILFKDAAEFSEEELKEIDLHIFIYEDLTQNIKELKEIDSAGLDYLVLRKKGIDDMEDVISKYSLSIPFYDIVSQDDTEIKIFAYGGKIIKDEKTYRSNVLAGNFDSESLQSELEKFILEQ